MVNYVHNFKASAMMNESRGLECRQRTRTVEAGMTTDPEVPF